MPLIDNYLLDSYLIDGLPSPNFLTSTPSVANTSVALTANQTGWLQTFSEIPPNSRFVSLAPASSGANWFIRAAVGASSGALAFGLMDANGIIWKVTVNTIPDNSNRFTFNMYSLQIDLVTGTSYYQGYYSNTQVYPSNTLSGPLQSGMGPVAMPTNFDMTRKMSLGVYISSTYTAGNWGAYFEAAGMRQVVL